MSDTGTTDGHGAPIDATIREATVQGVRWTSLVRLGTEILALASMVVLTHLISPAEFGAVAVVMIVNEVANGLAGTGYGAPLVQRETITRRHVEAVAALSIGTSACSRCSRSRSRRSCPPPSSARACPSCSRSSRRCSSSPG